jgi:hypothetical protein
MSDIAAPDYLALQAGLHASPSLEVETTDGYRPRLDQIVAFINHGMP